MIIKQQKPAKMWQDEQGAEIPYARITPIERLKEKYAFQLAKKASGINSDLINFKDSVKLMCEEIFNTVMTEKERTKVTKGNFTWYSFDGGIKIEVSINELIEFDSLLIEKAKQLLLELVSEGIDDKKAFLKELVLSAFQTSKGKLDTKKVFGLKKHTARISDKRYHEAMDLIDLAIRRPSSKTYFRIWIKDENGKYQNIDLNFSSI